MTITVRCPSCGTSHKAPERAAGKVLACLKCSTAMQVPSAEPEPIDPAAILLQDDEPAREMPTRSVQPIAGQEVVRSVELPAAKPRKKSKSLDVASLPPLSSNDPPPWRRHLHWLLVLALIPLVVSLVSKSDDGTLDRRLEEGLKQLTPEERDQVEEKLEHLHDATIDDLVDAFPGHKLPGAFLGRASLGHLGMAVAATLIYMAFFMFLAADGSANPIHVLLVGLFTATIGVGFLLLVQLLASLVGGRLMLGANVIALILLVLNFIAFSYSAAMNPDNGFMASFLGFTCGVGLCEELVKAIPIFWHRSTESGRTWRGMLIWGLASGAGFGIAESIMYSGRYYNGIAGPGIYLVRFLSCVSLHAIWSGSVSILLFIRRDSFSEVDQWYEWIFPILTVIGVPAVLHGLYDTCLKKDMNGVALLVALASFGYLAFLFSRLQTVDDVAANKALLREYQRRRAAMN